MAGVIFHPQFDDVGMAEELEILDFSPDFAHDIQTLDLIAIQDFDGHLMASKLMLTN